MAQAFLHTMFGPRSRALQEAAGSRAAYARMEANAAAVDSLTNRELEFVAARDSFYMASISEDGWPYVQHRGGPAGFLRWISGNRIGFADYRGNRQYLSAANLAGDDRVSLFLMDYPNQRRLKLIGHAHGSDDPAVIARLMVPDYAATPERAFLIDVTGFDWNCPQHIAPRFTEAEIRRGVQPLHDELDRLRARVAELEASGREKRHGLAGRQGLVPPIFVNPHHPSRSESHRMSTEYKRRVAFALTMGLFTKGVITFALVSINAGFSGVFIDKWLRSWGMRLANTRLHSGGSNQWRGH